MKMKKINNMLETDISKDFSQKNLGVLRVDF